MFFYVFLKNLISVVEKGVVDMEASAGDRDKNAPEGGGVGTESPPPLSAPPLQGWRGTAVDLKRTKYQVLT